MNERMNVPCTSLTTRAGLLLGIFPHYFLKEYERFGGTYCLYHQDRIMVAAVSLKILLSNYQTARNHTLQKHNLHNVPKIGDIKMWLLEMNGVVIVIHFLFTRV
jgi:hypothetical protein